MTIQELRNQVVDNIEMCKKSLASGDLKTAETYLGYANKATLRLLQKEAPEQPECPWEESGVACWSCTNLYCQFNGED